MYNINDYIIYKKEVCKILEIIPNYYNNQDYYLLQQLSDNTLTIKAPINSKDIRSVITITKVKEIIKDIPNIEVIKSDTKTLENTYKELISTGKHTDLIKIIKTSYLRNKERIDNNKKTTDKDNYYFNLAEKYLYNEFSIVLNLSYDETKQYVINNVTNLLNK